MGYKEISHQSIDSCNVHCKAIVLFKYYHMVGFLLRISAPDVLKEDSTIP